jgi:predicted membrane GTPase involved in stress response
MNDLEARGTMFVPARTEVYNGMIFGEHSKVPWHHVSKNKKNDRVRYIMV